VRYKNKVSLGDPVLEHRTRVGLREERERGARASLAIMTKLADRVAAAPGAVVPDDLWRLMRWRKLAEDTFNETAAYFLEPLHDKKPELAAHGYELLSNLMAGSFMIGATATVSESAKQKFERDAKVVSAAFGSDGGNIGKITKKANAAERWREMREMAKKIVDERSRTWSRLALISEIKERLFDSPDALPRSDKTIDRMIVEMLRKGEISLDA
jgi:hypothetical protein